LDSFIGTLQPPFTFVRAAETIAIYRSLKQPVLSLLKTGRTATFPKPLWLSIEFSFNIGGRAHSASARGHLLGFETRFTNQYSNVNTLHTTDDTSKPFLRQSPDLLGVSLIEEGPSIPSIQRIAEDVEPSAAVE
jgi:hypothetical protein